MSDCDEMIKYLKLTVCFSHPLGLVSDSEAVFDNSLRKKSKTTNPIITPPMLSWNIEEPSNQPINPNPNLAGIQWHRFNHANRAYLHMTTHKCTMKRQLRANKVAFWNILLPRLINQLVYVKPLMTEDTHETRMWILLGVAVVLMVCVLSLVCVLLRSKMCKVWRSNTRPTAV